MTLPSIEVHGLTKRFGSFTALDKLDLKLEGGKCVGFLGPNGAGKTTTLKMLTDMIFPTEGECFLNGISVQRERKRAMESAGVLIESPEIYPSLTATQALRMVAELRNMSREEQNARIPAILEEVKMADWADQKVGKYSKGMKQRLNIAAALVPDPEIVILDEPATGLDPRGMAEVRSIVRDLKKHDRLIFMSSHILAEVTDVCDEVALINHGKLLFYDTLDNVTARFSSGQSSMDASFAHPVSEETLRGKLDGNPDLVKYEQLDPRRFRLSFKGGLPAQGRLLRQLSGEELELVSFQESKSVLEEIYLSQIEKGD
ncbi:MAG: ABC transporter ATP-binding protein [Thermoplasmata archaeon]|nr:ABC transporter ATP-binding protein [Thermoplasmata archaeon]MCI4337762.1 ABC transporter ATP-binding protein [Thermoplasmata archaeon]MCI4341392.1 ABC transporter ATP-binding protein [Thermoplasmata archaeon]